MNFNAKCVSENALRPYTDDVCEMIGSQLGSNYLSTDEMNSVIRADTDKHLVVAMPDETGEMYNNTGVPVQIYYTPLNENVTVDYEELPETTTPTVIAATIGFTLPLIKFASEIELSGQSFPNVFANKSKIGLVDGTSVHDDFSRSGIGQRVLRLNAKMLKKKGCDILCAWAWRNRKGIYGGHIFSQADFRPEREYQNYWKNQSINTGFYCPCCGPPPCNCSAILYVHE